VDSDCGLPDCIECWVDDPEQTCGPPQIVPNVCGLGTCPANESCCSGQLCCRNLDQVCQPGPPPSCLRACPGGTSPCGADNCCDANAGESCNTATGQCQVQCGPMAVCNTETQFCCSSICCDADATYCDTSLPGSPQCRALPDCGTGEVYLPPPIDTCCPQQQVCGTTGCCNALTEHCETATGQCVPNP
jgi:hypothetical protein